MRIGRSFLGLTDTRGYFRLKMGLTWRRCPWWLIFLKNLFYQKNCKAAMNIGGGQIRGALFNFLSSEKCPFLHLLDTALSFYNFTWTPISHKNHTFNKTFNRNKIKVSHSCIQNTKTITNNHNMNILHQIMKLNMDATAEIRSTVL